MIKITHISYVIETSKLKALFMIAILYNEEAANSSNVGSTANRETALGFLRTNCTEACKTFSPKTNKHAIPKITPAA